MNDYASVDIEEVALIAKDESMLDAIAEWKAKICAAVPVPAGVVVTPESVANCPETLVTIKEFSEQAGGKA